MRAHLHVSTHLCQAIPRCPRAVTPALATSKRQRWARSQTKRDSNQLCLGHQRHEVPDDHESHQSSQPSEPRKTGISSTGATGTSGGESQDGAGGAAAAAPSQPPAGAAEPLVPWGIEVMVIVTIASTFGSMGVFGAAAGLLQQSFPDMAVGRAFAIADLMGSLVHVLLAAGLVKVIRRDWEPPPLGSFPLGRMPSAQWKPLLTQILKAFVLTALICTVLLSLLPPGPVADHHAKEWRDQAAMLGQVLGGGDLVAGGLYFLAACACSPVAEEIVFQGFVLPSLLRYFPPWAAVLASAVIYSGAHLSFDVVRLTLGLALGIVFLRARNLWPPILLHAVWNFRVVLVFCTLNPLP